MKNQALAGDGGASDGRASHSGAGHGRAGRGAGLGRASHGGADARLGFQNSEHDFQNRIVCAPKRIHLVCMEICFWTTGLRFSKRMSLCVEDSVPCHSGASVDKRIPDI